MTCQTQETSIDDNDRTQTMNQTLVTNQYIAIDDQGYIGESKQTIQETINELAESYQEFADTDNETWNVLYNVYEIPNTISQKISAGDHELTHPELQELEPIKSGHIEINPTIPDCIDSDIQYKDDHDWQQDGDAWGLGAGIIVGYTCTKCKLEKTIKTNQSIPNDNQQIYNSIKYTHPDDD